MLCAHTVRRLKPGTFDQFAEAFRPPDGETPPAGWARFVMLRPHGGGDEVVTFGFFDGTLEELENSQDRHGYEERRAAASQYVDEVLSNGIYEIVHDYRAAGATV
jgi:hypothetical protein